MNESPLPLRQFVQDACTSDVMSHIRLAEKMLEIESIENWFRLMYGVELEIDVVSYQMDEKRWYGKSLIDAIRPKT